MIANTRGSLVLKGFEFQARASEVLAEFPVIQRPQSDEIVRIRVYHESDRERIRQLCCDTGFLGRPVDALFQDRQLFADLFTKPYLDYESDWILVAEADGRLVGYLLGSVRRGFDLLQLWSGFKTSARMVMRLAAGRYARHARSRRFLRWLFTRGFWEQPRHPRNAAHLHLDIIKQYRGRGIGRRLWELYERRLREAGIAACYGAFFSCPKRRPETVYARYGFSVFDRRPTTLFQPEISDPVEVVCVSKNL